MFINKTNGSIDSLLMSDIKSITFKNSATEGGIIPAVMLAVSGGMFQMGSTTGQSNEQPVHAVTVGSFSIDKYEVTYEKWTEVRTWGLLHGYTDLPAGQNGSSPSGANNPVTMVNWYDVIKWCNARSEMGGLTPVYYTRSVLDTVYRTGELGLPIDAVKWTSNGYRLPTEAEWEFASRGGIKSNNYSYSGSNVVGDVAWYTTNSGATTHPIGQKTANELGICDMSGNVYEWCWDLYGVYSIGAQMDPKGPTSGTVHVLRSGSYYDLDLICRTTYRVGYNPSGRSNLGGFRCVQD
jgi:formylglycine-generating enzyme required for sulfatase activity